MKLSDNKRIKPYYPRPSMKGNNNPAKRPDVRTKISISRKGINNRPNYEHPTITKKKISISHIGNRNPMWKGGVSHYYSIHGWVKKWKGKADHCEMCSKINGKFQWANMDHKYNRILEDYISMCQSCHDKYDKKFHNKYNKKTKK